jgi:hypothetical protein
MDSYRLKTKIGDNEFDAEGDPETVNAQFQAFKELVAMALAAPPPVTVAAPVSPPMAAPATPPRLDLSAVDAQLPKIMKVDDRIVSLTVRAKDVDDAVLLLLYGQRILRETDGIGGFEVVGGLATTGQRVDRVDRVLDRAARDGYAIIIGERRARRYRLTNTGLTKAREIAAELIATVA